VGIFDVKNLQKDQGVDYDREHPISMIPDKDIL